MAAEDVKRLIRVRVEKGARFKRDGFGKKRQISDSWRKPRGQHNKQREQKKAKGALPRPGFGSPLAVRGMHPSGFFEVLVASRSDLEGLDPKKQAVRIGATVGARKRAAIQEQAVAAGFRVLNIRVARAPAKPAKAKSEKKEEDVKPKSEKKSLLSRVRAEPVKKEVEERTKAAADKETAPKAAKPPKKAPAKSAKAAAKPKAEKAADAKSKAAAKPRAKTTKSGVKKNE
jgi:large subunit ribosomal protein L32e